ncbi:MAG: hypothetical protein WEB53_10630 [Akkermansiaceae bacterium]
MKNEKGSSYWARNIVISRSKTVVDGVTHRVTGETDVGQPYGGFLSARQCANIILRNCVVHGRKTYQKIGSAGKTVSMGTYGYHGDLVVDFRMIHCRMGNDINDRSRWGVVATNFMKNILVENCVLSRVDVHMGFPEPTSSGARRWATRDSMRSAGGVWSSMTRSDRETTVELLSSAIPSALRATTVRFPIA